MNSLILLEAIGYLDDELLERSEKRANVNRRNVFAIVALAACLCLVLIGIKYPFLSVKSDEAAMEPNASDMKDDVVESITDSENTSDASGVVDCDAISFLYTGEIASTNAEYPYVVLIGSKNELEDYITVNHESLSQTEFESMVQKYDMEYFEQKQLIIVVLEEVSGLIRHKVKNVYVEEDQLVISVIRKHPQVYTDDMAYWHILLEIDKGVITSADQIRVDLFR